MERCHKQAKCCARISRLARREELRCGRFASDQLARLAFQKKKKKA
jgi:hypothetical protein